MEFTLNRSHPIDEMSVNKISTIVTISAWIQPEVYAD